MNESPITPNSAAPIFRQALLEGWDALAPVIQAHYALLPFTDCAVEVRGTMVDITYSPYAKLLIPFTTLVGALVPFQGQNVPVKVINSTHAKTAGLHWQRTFFFHHRKPFMFRSVMAYTGSHEITEFVRFGFGIRLNVSHQNGGLVFRDKGYIWKVGRLSIPVPVNLMLGKAYIEEMPISDREFSMKMVVTHPIFGQTFQYNGTFTMAQR
jgi:hypothetical protein